MKTTFPTTENETDTDRHTTACTRRRGSRREGLGDGRVLTKADRGCGAKSPAVRSGQEPAPRAPGALRYLDRDENRYLAGRKCSTARRWRHRRPYRGRCATRVPR